MGALLDKARAEAAEIEQRNAERHNDAERRRLEHHREQAGPAAAWFSEWSGAEISADELREDHHVVGPGHRWTVAIEGFNLIIVDSGQVSNGDHRFYVEQRLSPSFVRRIHRPAELLQDGKREAGT